MTHNIYIYILIMGGISYLIRVLPMTLIRKPLKNQFLQSFLYCRCPFSFGEMNYLNFLTFKTISLKSLTQKYQKRGCIFL